MASTIRLDPSPARSTDRGPALGWPVRGGLAIIGLALAAGALVWPLWRAHLIAPQYPKGLHLVAYGHGVTGDVDEIDMLNHYVGMRAFDPADVPEMGLWPFAVGLAFVAVLAAILVRQRFVRLGALMYLWSMPLGVLVAIQLRLYQYGHDLDPGAALRIPEFTPWVIGPTRVWNFTTWSFPGLGLLTLLAAAAVVTFGPLIVRRIGRTSAVALSTAFLLVVSANPVFGVESHHEGHQGHGRHGSEPAHAPHGHGLAPAEIAPVPSPAGQGAAVQESRKVQPAGSLARMIAKAGPGDTVFVGPGAYHGTIVIDVPIRLVGRGQPLLQGNVQGSVLVIRAPGTEVHGILVRGSGLGPVGDPAGIRIEADDVLIQDVVVEDSYHGIAVVGAARTRLVGNMIEGRRSAAIVGENHAVQEPSPLGYATVRGLPRGDGLWIWEADGILVRGNHIHHTRDGAYVSFGSGALIDGNHITDSRYAVHTMFARDLVLAENHFERNLSGAVLMYAGPALLLRNLITDNYSVSTGFGVLLKDIDDAQIVQNVIAWTRVGLHLDGPTGGEPTRVHANTVSGNVIGVVLYPSARAAFSANSFVRNDLQVVPQGGTAKHVSWSDRGWGNYWSTYRGYTGHFEGRGAVPHAEGGGVEQLLLASPQLQALATSPGLRLIRALEERWGFRSPAAVDPLPLTRPQSPPVPAPASESATAWVALMGVLMTVAALVGLRRSIRSGRIPGTRVAATGRSVERACDAAA